MAEPKTPHLIIDFVCNALLPLLDDRPLRHLDVGAGWGHLIRKLKAARPQLQCEACDYPLAPELGDIPAREANLNAGKLPYDDNTFDVITCTEVFEHIENAHPIVREMFRILKPGGIVMVSTPNMLNLRSRVKFLARGTFEYFDPLSTRADLGGHAWTRHITPITFFHLSLMMVDAGFERPQHHPGKVQKFSAAFYWLAVPFFRWSVNAARRTRIRKGRPVTPLCEDLAAEHNSWNVLTSRTLIVSARKPLDARAVPAPIISIPAPESLQ
jgi:2-polyprenyl-3-methyl-5-hydroxy-6-metoxy-1,4-benzoquinol methylase